MKYLLTFIGTGPRHETTYIQGEQRFTTAHFSLALVQWYQPDEMLVLLTEQAHQSENWRWLLANSPIPLRPIAIPNGKDEAEQWQMFQAITDALQPEDRLIFDITHGFRSLPVLALLAAVYLRLVKHIVIEAMVYGAYEAGDREAQTAPVVDMTPFLSLLDWVSAAEEVIQTGSSQRVGRLLKEIHAQLHKSRSGLPQVLSKTGSALQQVSNALMLSQPLALADAVAGLEKHLAQVNDEAERWTLPFVALAQTVQKEYAEFKANDLATQRRLIRWYLRHNHHAQAVTLAREWIVSLICHHMIQRHDPERFIREQVEHAFNGYVQRKIDWNQALKEKLKRDATLDPSKEEENRLKKLSLQDYLVNQIPDVEQLEKLWSQVREQRNQIAHCGMGRESGKLDKLKTSIEELVNQLEQVVLPGSST